MNLLDESQEEAKADLTPMIDCVFLMLVFFVCLDFRSLESRLPAYLPRDRGGHSMSDPVEQVSVQIHCAAFGQPEPRYPNGLPPWPARPRQVRLAGHEIRWQLGPRPIDTAEELRQQLGAIYADRACWQPDPDQPGALLPPSVVVEPYPGTVYDDVARTVDMVRAAGFAKVFFGGGLGARPR